MYADSGLMYPYFLNFSQQVQPLDDLSCYSQEPTSSLDSIITTSTISDYDLGGGGDLFKAPKPIIEEPFTNVNPMTSTMAMISCVDDVIPNPGLKVGGIESLQNEPLLCDVFDGCQKELLEKTSVQTAISDVVDVKLPITMMNEVPIEDAKSHPGFSVSKSDSSGCLNTMDWVSSGIVRPSFLDFPEMDFGAAYGMRRAFSEGDIKTLANGNLSLIHSPLKRPLVIGNCPSEERLQQLSRYRNKKSRRNFGRKIKYACRKALADSQPRIRGRFAKTEEADGCKKL